MKVACLSFSQSGKKLAREIEKLKGPYDFTSYRNQDLKRGIKAELARIWKDYEAIVFISATGIAVRMIKDLIEDKTRDPAIVVMDDIGKFSISLLSGHLGGANDLANYLAREIGSQPVITTATDNRGIEAVDIFAKRNDYTIYSMEEAKKITSLMVDGGTIGFYSEDRKLIGYENLRLLDSLGEEGLRGLDGIIIVSSKKLELESIPKVTLIPKNIYLGLGSKKGVLKEDVVGLIKREMAREGYYLEAIKAIGSVDVKKEEEGLIEGARYFNKELKIIGREEILKVEDGFPKSEFVKDTIGVYSVAEPVAYLLSRGETSPRSSYKGVSLSIGRQVANDDLDIRRD